MLKDETGMDESERGRNAGEIAAVPLEGHILDPGCAAIFFSFGEHGGRHVHPDHLLEAGSHRNHHPPGAAAEIECRSARQLAELLDYRWKQVVEVLAAGLEELAPCFGIERLAAILGLGENAIIWVLARYPFPGDVASVEYHAARL